MRRLFSDLCFIAAGLLALILFAQSPRAQFNSFPPGAFTGRAALDAGGAPAYTGPGNLSLSSTFVAWYGYRCFSAAYSGNVADIWDGATGSTTHTLITCSGGAIQTGSPTALAVTCAMACEVSNIYDQAGTHCDGSVACNMQSAGHGFRPTFLPTGSPDGTKGCQTTSTGDATILTTANIVSPTTTLTQAIPFSMSLVHKQTTVGAAVQQILGSDTAAIRDGFENTAAPNNKHVLFNGSAFPGAVASNNAFHAFNDTFAASSSSIVSIDGTSTTGLTLGSSTAFSATGISVGKDGIGVFCEGGILNGALTTGDNSTLSTNQHSAANGWNF